MSFTFIELFAGIGGMGHGLMQAGMECVGFAEIDKFAHQAYNILHNSDGRMWEAYDVRAATDEHLRVLGRERGTIDLIAGGFPCQAFSIAGKRKGFADQTRGTLFFEIIRYASILRPKYLLLENVKGLFSHDEGRTFATILCALDELGYDAEWQLLNSAAYVPQNRERVFIIGHLRGSGGRKVFPFGAENENTIKVAGKLDCGYNDQNSRVYSAQGLAPTLPTMQGGGQEPKVLVNVNQHEMSRTETSLCLDANYFKGLGANQSRTGIMEPVIAQRPRGNNKGGLHQIAPTLTSNSYQENNHLMDGYRIRKLTPLECFRLQSFPDEWYYTLKEQGISDSQLYKMSGNAVTSIVAYEIGKRIAEGHRIDRNTPAVK